MFDVITFGSALLDIFVKTDAEYMRIHNPMMDEVFLSYPVGAKLEVSDLQHHIGGGGINTATTFSRMGLHTGFIGKIGGDVAGLDIFKFLKNEDITFLGAVGEKTGTSIILDSYKDDRTILTYKGTSNTLKYTELNLAKLNANWYYFSSVNHESFQTMVKLANHATKKKIKVVFNPSSYQCAWGYKKLKPLLDHVDVLILNRSEAKMLTHKNSTDELLKALLAYGHELVVITAGKKGVYVSDGEFFYHANPGKRLKIVETTGAGDAFASGFISGLAYGKDIETSIKWGMNNAESVISHYGAQNLILTKYQALKKAKSVKRKVFKHEF